MTIVESDNKQELEGDTKIAREKILPLMLLNGGANYKRYIGVHNQRANQFTQGVDGYHNIIENAICLLNNYKSL